jgi:hypothetical protein
MSQALVAVPFVVAMMFGIVEAAPTDIVCPDAKIQRSTVDTADQAKAVAGTKGNDITNSTDKCVRCSDQKISFETNIWRMEGYVIITPVRACRTQADLETYGCSSWCPTCTREPSITLEIPAEYAGGKTANLTRSKCDPQISSAISRAAGQGDIRPLQALRPPQIKGGDAPGGKEAVQGFLDKNATTPANVPPAGTSISDNTRVVSGSTIGDRYESNGERSGGSGFSFDALGLLKSFLSPNNSNSQDQKSSQDSSGAFSRLRSLTDGVRARAPSVTPTATLVVWPETAPKGGAIVAHWSSVGMKASSCRLTAPGARVEGQSGSRSVRVPNAADSIEVTLSCTGLNGKDIDVRERVEVESL